MLRGQESPWKEGTGIQIAILARSEYRVRIGEGFGIGERIVSRNRRRNWIRRKNIMMAVWLLTSLTMCIMMVAGSFDVDESWECRHPATTKKNDSRSPFASFAKRRPLGIKWSRNSTNSKALLYFFWVKFGMILQDQSRTDKRKGECPLPRNALHEKTKRHAAGDHFFMKGL